jgi:hypothetical protein
MNSWSRVCRNRIEDGIFETSSRHEMEQMCHHKARIYHSDGYCCHNASATMESGVAMSPLWTMKTKETGRKGNRQMSLCQRKLMRGPAHVTSREVAARASRE